MARSNQRTDGGWGSSGLIPLPVSGLDAASLDFDLYLSSGESRAPILYRERNHPIEAVDLERLVQRGITTLYISADDEESYRRFAETRIEMSRSAPPAEQYRILTDVRRAMFESVFRDGSTSDVLEFADHFSGDLGRIVCDSDVMLSDLFKLMRHDDYTYTHCVNVCTYAVLLAKRLGATDPQTLVPIARGALLHDIGKRKIKLSILHKPGRLTPEERTIMEEHPLLGFKELVLRNEVTWEELMMVYQHHERIDGRGYPVGVPGDDIHPWAKMCVVADVFHALTSRRPYRTPMSCEKACQFLELQSNTHVDQEMVQCWTAMITTECNTPS